MWGNTGVGENEKAAERCEAEIGEGDGWSWLTK